jgi:hypothetical protein
MSHIDSENIKKQRKRLQNQKYNHKKRQKTEETCPEQNLITQNDDVQFVHKEDYIPENLPLTQQSENNLSFDENNLSSDSIYSNDTINLDDEDQNDYDNDDYIEHEQEKNLYNESNTSLKELGITLFSLKFQHKMSEAALDDILKIFNMILPQGNTCPKSTKTLAQQIQCVKNITIYKICTTEECQNIQSESNNTTFCEKCNNKELIDFAVYGIIEQLKTVINNPSYIAQLRKSNKHREFKSLAQQFPINSALDGSIHLNLPHDNDNEITISFNINTDGAPLIKSRNFSMWPVLASIVELNQSSRESFRNVILLGLWLHKKKPQLNGFFSKCYEEIIQFRKEKLLIGTLNYFLLLGLDIL